MRPLSMLALSRLDMAVTVSLRRAVMLAAVRRTAVRGPALADTAASCPFEAALFSVTEATSPSSAQSFSKFMNSEKYL